jgi:hypothetical protein
MTSTQNTATPPTATSLFGGAPQQTYASSQGSILLYKDANCASPLSNTATPLLLGDCLNVPVSGIIGIEINSLPACGDFGTPLLIVSNQPDCKGSTAGASADDGVVMNCQKMDQGNEIGSMRFECFGHGTASVTASGAEQRLSVRRWNVVFLVLQVVGACIYWI